MAPNLCWVRGCCSSADPDRVPARHLPVIQALLAIVLAVSSGAGQWPAQPTGRKLSEDNSRSSLVLTAVLLFLYVGVENAIGGWVALLTLRNPSTQSLWAILLSAVLGGMLIGRMVTPSLLDVLRSRVTIIAGLLLAFAAAAYLIGGGGSHWSITAGALS